MEIKIIPTIEIIPLERFSLHPNDMHGLHQLANSMRCHGMKLPLIVRREEKFYRLIDGNKRLHVWLYLKLGENIPCLIIDASTKPNESLLPFTITEPPSLKENQQAVYDLYTMIALNLVRSKMDKDVLKAIVKYLYDEIGLGYGTIAQRIGYSKAGVKKMLNRMDAEKDSAIASSSPPSHVLRRLRTELKKLAETIPSTADDADKVMDAIRCLHGYLDSLIQSA